MEEDQTILARNQPECMFVLLVYGESRRNGKTFTNLKITKLPWTNKAKSNSHITNSKMSDTLFLKILPAERSLSVVVTKQLVAVNSPQFQISRKVKLDAIPVPWVLWHTWQTNLTILARSCYDTQCMNTYSKPASYGQLLCIICLKLKKSNGKKENTKLFEKPEVHSTHFKLPQILFLYQVKYNQYGLGSHWQLNN